MDIEECFKKNLIKKTRVDKELINSLIQMSELNEKTVKKAKLDEDNISSYVSLSYESLRQILEAICISKGYKVLSHICIGELLKDLLEDFDYNEFDRLRYARNSINYYGEKIEFKQGKLFINKIFSIKKNLLEKFLK